MVLVDSIQRSFNPFLAQIKIEGTEKSFNLAETKYLKDDSGSHLPPFEHW